MVDLGTGNNNKINWAMNDKQEFIDIVETVYRGARKGRGLVVSPKGERDRSGDGPSNAALPCYLSLACSAAPPCRTLNTAITSGCALTLCSLRADYSTKYRY